MYINITQEIQIIFIKSLQELITENTPLIHIKGIDIWNNLSNDLKNIKSYAVLRERAKLCK